MVHRVDRPTLVDSCTDVISLTGWY